MYAIRSYYDIARLHSGILSYARDFMIDRGFTYYIPPYMIRSDVVTGVMSFAEMENMMYKIEGEDLYLIGTSVITSYSIHYTKLYDIFGPDFKYALQSVNWWNCKRTSCA